MAHSQPFAIGAPFLIGQQWLLMRSSCDKVTAGLSSPTHFGQSFRSLRDHVYSPLQFLLKVGDVHLVRDAIGVADALHIAVLHHFLQTPQHRYAWQLQNVRDLTCANGRAHDRAQEDVDAYGSVVQAVTVGRKLGAVVVRYGPHQAQVEATDEKPLAC